MKDHETWPNRLAVADPAPIRRYFTGDAGVQLSGCCWDGEGTNVLLVHGLASNALLWQGVGAELAMAGLNVAALDLRGHGLSDKPDAGYDYTTVSRDVAQVLEGWASAAPVHIAGQSWGGNVVLRVALDRPDLIAGVIAVDGGMIDLASRFPNWDECAATLAPPKLLGTALAELERRVHEWHPDWPETGLCGSLGCFELHEDGTVAPWLTLERHMAILRAMWEEGPSAWYGGIEVPVLFIPARPSDGSSNPLMGKEEAVRVAASQVRRSRVEWVTGDHDLHAQHPRHIAGLIMETIGLSSPR